MHTRQATEREFRQGADEATRYKVDVTRWAGEPTSATHAVKNEATGADVTATVAPGSCTIVGNVITTPSVSGLAAGMLYRLEIRWVAGGSTWETFVLLRGEA